MQTRKVELDCFESLESTYQYSLITPDFCSDYLNDQAVIECYTDGEDMIDSYTVTMMITHFHPDGVQTLKNTYTGLNLEVIAFINTKPVFQIDIDEETIYVREEEETLYYFPDILEKDPDQDASPFSSDAPPFV